MFDKLEQQGIFIYIIKIIKYIYKFFKIYFKKIKIYKGVVIKDSIKKTFTDFVDELEINDVLRFIEYFF